MRETARRTAGGGPSWRPTCIVLAALCVIVVLGGCATQPPAPVGGWNWRGPVPEGFYLVRPGDTLSEVAQRQRINYRTLARWNRLEPPYRIYAGTLLRLSAPEPGAPASTATRAPPPASAPAGSTASPAAGASSASRTAAAAVPPAANAGSRRAASGVDWAWPLPQGIVAKSFKEGDRVRQGLRIQGAAGDRVLATAGGQVVYSGGGLKGYGNLIIVKHNDKYLSAYGFNRALLVREGERVKRGQALADIGQSADGTYLLHFEIRRDGTAVDPILYLPPRK